MKAAILLLALCTPSWSLAAELVTVESKDKTSADIPLKCVVQKTTINIINHLVIQAKVSNKGDTAYKFVKVTISVYDKDKKFLGRNEAYANPSEIGKDEVGYIDMSVDLDGRRPAKIEVKVTGRP